jgi:hypothetical protein
MFARPNRFVLLTAGGLLLALSRLGGLPADISVIALDPMALAQSPVERIGSDQFHGGPVMPVSRAL